MFPDSAHLDPAHPGSVHIDFVTADPAFPDPGLSIRAQLALQRISRAALRQQLSAPLELPYAPR